ncbi:exo-rhamnogalacturonan lyase family protein [Pedococcus sp. 5OH_020]|uniref:exo-rhamnogalacturonan lyase family protein n=1 Tax=Pedococcus sp. 5OH_020 TaxID=2989814 RepID=UPI0022E9C0E2|nr:Tat pathway signal sequence domain protein [Pedococcus sp. 5OH_020]
MGAQGDFSRRVFLGGFAAAAATVPVVTAQARASAADTTSVSPVVADDAGDGVLLHWLDGAPATTNGAAWGVPWARGKVSKGTALALTTASGKPVPLQSWPLAYWPDGSLKWTGHAIAADQGLEKTLRLAEGQPASPAKRVTVDKRGDDVVIDTGAMTVTLGGSGDVALKSLTRGSRTTARDGRLVLRLQDQPEEHDGEARQSSWTGAVTKATVEQQGPVRAVVRLEGKYTLDQGPNHGNGDRQILPWTLRVYATAGSESLRLVHSFVWDGDASKDFVRGLGLQVQVPLSDEAHNRHIRFAGSERGVWGEPVRVLTGLRRDPGAAVNEAQFQGTATPPVSAWAAQVRDGYQELPLWNDFTLVQNNASSFAVWKRTSPAHCWLKGAGFGTRAPGLGYVGGVSGGLAFGMRDFWQQFPRALDIRGAAGDAATVTLWSWSPHGNAMDLRPYDAHGHGLDLAYEDNRDGFGDPRGISRSTELELWALGATPSRERFADLAEAVSAPAQVVASPQTYHGASVFGHWSLPDRSTAARVALEDSITAGIAFYTKQVQQRQWYGFWDYGDVMHTYDADRHTWRYDVGGFAWDNAELGSDASLWYSFLRTGDAGTFRLAKAMTRHVSESDSYLAGRFAGLGSRHNVVQWGCGSKEGRVNESFNKRFLYYVTAEELVGDWMRATLQADDTLLKYEPLRDILPATDKAPSRLRIGPDWYALVSNWMTEWERTGDVRWRDRIITGMRDIATFPAGLFTGEGGGAVGYDPRTAHLVNLEAGDYKGGYNLAMAFCGDQIMFEVVELVDVPEFRKVLLDFARYVQAPTAEKVARYGFTFDPQVFKTIYSRVTAWAGAELDDASLRKRGWQQLQSDPAGRPWPAAVTVDGTDVLAPVEEIPAGDFATNDFAQRNLAIIELLALAPQEAP